MSEEFVSEKRVPSEGQVFRKHRHAATRRALDEPVFTDLMKGIDDQ